MYYPLSHFKNARFQNEYVRRSRSRFISIANFFSGKFFSLVKFSLCACACSDFHSVLVPTWLTFFSESAPFDADAEQAKVTVLESESAIHRLNINYLKFSNNSVYSSWLYISSVVNSSWFHIFGSVVNSTFFFITYRSVVNSTWFHIMYS